MSKLTIIDTVNSSLAHLKIALCDKQLASHQWESSISLRSSWWIRNIWHAPEYRETAFEPATQNKTENKTKKIQ